MVPAVQGQLFQWDQPDPYVQVFVETDNFDTTYLQQLETGIQLTASDSLRLTLLNDLGYYWHTRNLDTADRVTREGLALARRSGIQVQEGRLLITLGAVLLRDEKLDSAELVLQQAEMLVPKADLPFLHTQLGYVMERRGLLDKAADEAILSLELGRELHDQKAIALAYSDLSNLFWKRGKQAEALDYGLRSLALFEQRGIQDLDYNFTMYVVGNVYLARKEYSKALTYYEAAIEMAERYGFYNNLSDIYISLIDLHTENERYEEALEASKEAIRYAELLDNAFLLMRSWLSVGKLYNLLEQPQEAIKSLTTSLEIATADFGDAFFLSKVYEELSKAYETSGQYRPALSAFQEYDSLKERVFSEQADRRIAELQTEFDLAQKEAVIESQHEQLVQKNRLQFATVGFIVLLVLLLLGVYRSFVRNKRMNKQLERRNEEKELLLKEIHHRVKNNLEIVSSLLELQYARFKDPSVQDAMQLSKNRVRSMGIIHQKLYQGKTLSSIEMRDYFINLGENILDSFEAADRIEIEYDMPQLEMDIETAVPVGLIVNEWLTNSLKYAFPSEKKGRIQIRLTLSPREDLILEVSDDGVGKWKSDPAPHKEGFGTHLVNLLVRQLDGQLKEVDALGTAYRLEFPADKRTKQLVAALEN